MASLSEPVETFEDVLKKVEGFTCEGLINADRVKYIVSDMARRFKAAHELDVGRLCDCLREAIDVYSCGDCTKDAKGTFHCDEKCKAHSWNEAIKKHGDAKKAKGF